MGKKQTNGFETIRQQFGNQYVDTYLDGKDCNIQGDNIDKIQVNLPLTGTQILVPQGSNTGMYEYSGCVVIDAYDTTDTVTIYDGESSNRFLNPFKSIYGDNLDGCTVHLVELYAYGYGSSTDNYITTTFRYKVDPKFPSNGSASGVRGCMSNRYTMIYSDDNWRCYADQGKITLKVEDITEEGTPVDADHKYFIGYKLRITRVH